MPLIPKLGSKVRAAISAVSAKIMTANPGSEADVLIPEFQPEDGTGSESLEQHVIRRPRNGIRPARAFRSVEVMGNKDDALAFELRQQRLGGNSVRKERVVQTPGGAPKTAGVAGD